ncbi:MAG: hypothetical protein IJ512_00395 [Ruminococcus sp.]|nr:hypothetical protein [Ruminococcus sp.]
MRKIFAVLFSICTLLCTGCSKSVTEVRDRIYIQGAKLGGSPTLTELTLYPFEETGTPISGEGLTMAAAIEETAVQSGKAVFMGHLELLCFDRASFTDSMQECMEEYRLSPACKLLYLHETELPEGIDTTLLTDQLRQEEENGRIPETDLFHVLSECAGDDGAALVPVLSEEGFGVGLLQNGEFLGTLSSHAVQGLCWLRGENYPRRISVAGNDRMVNYEVHSAQTELSAEIQNGIPHVTVTLRLRGSGNSEAAKRLIKAACSIAAEETVKEMHADVIGLDACLRKDCPKYYAQHDFETAKFAAVFDVVVTAS